MLAGVLLMLCAFWAHALLARLWQGTLLEAARSGIAAAEAAGLGVRLSGTRARLIAEGTVGGRPVRVEWRGGALGLRSVVRDQAGERVLPLLDTPESVEVALGLTPAE